MAVLSFLCFLLLSSFRHRAGHTVQRIRLRTRYSIMRQRYLRRSRPSAQLRQVSTFAVFSQVLLPLHRASRRFWAAPRRLGFWEKDVCRLWRRMGRSYPDWENNQYVQNFRMSKDTFWFLSQTYKKYFEREDTHMRRAIPATKRIAILLHWLAHSSSFSQLAVLYALGKSTIVSIVHEGIDILCKGLVPQAIKFPTGSELSQVMVDFEALCGLPFCAGAIDGTFMPIKKPKAFGDTYFCYKKFCSIIVLGCVDARGIFTYVNSGRPGSVGDSYTYRNSMLHENIESGEWLSHPPRLIEGVQVKPYLVADAAFPLSQTCMKCYEDSGSTQGCKRSFNYSLIRTRRVVEQAFGRLKGRWQIMNGTCRINDPLFARRIAMVCSALHNVCERNNCPFEIGWLPEESAYVQITPDNAQSASSSVASSVRDAVAKYIHRHRPAPN